MSEEKEKKPQPQPRTNRCPECGLRYRGVKAGNTADADKVERHNNGYHHNTRLATLAGPKW